MIQKYMYRWVVAWKIHEFGENIVTSLAYLYFRGPLESHIILDILF